MQSNQEGHRLIVSVDPGFGGTGVCMFIDSQLYRFTNLKSGEEGNARYIDVASRCARNVLNWINDFRAVALYPISRVDVVVESPHAMGGASGHASLARGDVFTVAKLAGAIGTVIALYVGTLMEDLYEGSTRVYLSYPEVREWKGQTPKDVTKKRVLRDIEYATAYIKTKKFRLESAYPDHIFDAAGLGMWFIKENDICELNVKQ